MHAPDLLAKPHLDRIVLNKVLRPVRQASGGTMTVPDGYSVYRIAEMHFADEDAYARYRQWFEDTRCRPNEGPAAAPPSSSTS